MAPASAKIPVLLTATQIDLLGEAVMAHIPQVASCVSKFSKMEPRTEEVSLLNAYLELAKVIIEPRHGAAAGSGARPPVRRVPQKCINGPSALQSDMLRLRQ